MAHHWGYAGSELPPERWSEQYSIAITGKRQSPINIESCKTQSTSLPPLNICYRASDVSSVSNNGHSVTFTANAGNSVLSGGPLACHYKLEQFHFHWGKDSHVGGSEHTIDGCRFAGEMHFVHWNSSKYGSLTESLEHPDGLCVLGTFIQANPRDNPAFKPVIDSINQVPLKGNKCGVVQGFDPSCLLSPNCSSYYHYKGSLTTPALQECVDWIVFKQPVCLSENQLNAFRNLHLGEDAASPHLWDNFRPTQNLCSRVVCSNN